MIHHSAEQRTVLLHLRLRVRDLVDQEADTALRDDIRGAVATLDQHHGLRTWGLGSMEPKKWDDVDDRVGEPADHGVPACRPNEVLNVGVLLLRGGLLQAVNELLHDVAEAAHGRAPEIPAVGQGWASKDALTGVPDTDHEGRGDAEVPALGAALLRRQLHDQDDL